MKINLLTVGKLKERYWTDAVNEYCKRLSRFASVRIIELPEMRTLQEEGKEILKKCSGQTILLDIDGDEVTSVGFADIMQDRLNGGISEFTFVIGSSEGLSQEVKDSGMRISFGRVTYPHQLMRVILCEQIYRACTILNGLTYHK